ncbi:MAG: hypothetical protein FGM18_01360 [Burkholderiaceae bacterium]|nr:hypothetical protein [Burkholderiaceae bacterium]
MHKHYPVVRHPAGLEWTLFKKIPLLTVVGFAVLGMLWVTALIWPWQSDPKAVDDLIRRIEFALIGAAIFHITMMVTLAIGCVVVLIMKGPRYSADSYPVEDAERPDR